MAINKNIFCIRKQFSYIMGVERTPIQTDPTMNKYYPTLATIKISLSTSKITSIVVHTEPGRTSGQHEMIDELESWDNDALQMIELVLDGQGIQIESLKDQITIIHTR